VTWRDGRRPADSWLPHSAQTTVTRYDLGGRATEVDDEFTCTSTTYDYRDLATSRVEGKAPGNPCTGTGSRTINDAYDGLGRRTSSVVAAGPTLEAVTYDGAGDRLSTSSTTGTITESSDLTLNALDQVTREYRKRFDSGTSTTSNEIWTRQNYDAAGNQTDRCTWAAAPSENCKPADQAMSNPQPASRSSSAYDARNNRVSLKVPGEGETTYDPTAGYQVDKVYVTTKTDANGNAIGEHLTDYGYDSRDRLDSITQQACLVTAGTHTCTGGTVATGSTDYGLDEVDNRTSVIEANGAGTVTRYYCYDAKHQLIAVRSATDCSTGLLETYAYDAARNRTGAPGDTFVYSAEGRLCLIDAAGPCPANEATWHVTYDAEGRTTKVTQNGTTWSYLYDGEGCLTAACQSSSCSGSGFARLDFAYDGEGRRTKLTETTAGGAATTTDFRYDGERVVGEVVSTGVTRTFTVDESGAIVKVSIAGDSAVRNGDYLVVWNGHGDALGLWRIKSDGSLEKANTYTYSTWGVPSITTSHPNSDQGNAAYGDLGFRYLYVGRHDVQWDDFAGAGLHYMHARHYRASIGRFLQPDPTALEANLYGYAENSPVTKADPAGTAAPIAIPVAACLADFPACLALVASGAYVIGQSANQIANYVATHPIEIPRVCLIDCTRYVGSYAGRQLAKRDITDKWYTDFERSRLRPADNPRVSPPERSKDPFRFKLCLQSRAWRVICIAGVGVLIGSKIKIDLDRDVQRAIRSVVRRGWWRAQ
jgi:RHS repeat-associated protein